jgi:hypothetical protein
MRLSQWLRDNPGVIVACLITGLGVWVLSGTARREREVAGPIVYVPVPIPEATPAAHETDPVSIARPVPVGVLPQLRVGMSRIEVEGLIGPPPADQVLPIAVVDGRATYQTAYPVDLDPAPVMTVRPFGRRLPPPPRPAPSPTNLVSLEFDASLPGHPLVNVHYLDPLF